MQNEGFPLLMSWIFWASIAAATAIGVGISFSVMRRKRPDFAELEKLRIELNEVKQVLRGNLKVSILFWSFFYKKEKIKTFEEAKKDVLQDLKKEMPPIRWVDTMLEEIRQELIKYNK